MANDHHPKGRGTWTGTYNDCIEIYWNQRRYKRTIPLDPILMRCPTRRKMGREKVGKFTFATLNLITIGSIYANKREIVLGLSQSNNSTSWKD